MSLGARTLGAAVTALPTAGLVLWGFDALGVRWNAAVLFVTAAAAVLAAGLRFRSTGPPAEPTARAGSGIFRILTDLQLAGAFSLFAVATALGWNVIIDFAFHWGLKGKRFALAGGVDYDFLSRPWNAHVHPDYPNLVPTLYGAVMKATGDFSWTSVAWLSILAFGLLLLAVRELAERTVESPGFRLLAVGIVAWGILAFGVRPTLAGGADLWIALAATLGALALARAPDRRTDVQVAWIAALAAGAKLEGIPLAAGLIGLHLLRRFLAERNVERTVIAALRSAWPTALTVAYWLFHVRKHGLFLETNTGGLDPERVLPVIVGLARILVEPQWHGLPLVLVALPLLLADVRLRWAAVLLGAQLTFYVYAYLAGPVDTELWIQTSASRLFFHLVPATAVLLAAFLDQLKVQPGLSSSPARE